MNPGAAVLLHFAEFHLLVEVFLVRSAALEGRGMFGCCGTFRCCLGAAGAHPALLLKGSLRLDMQLTLKLLPV